MYLNHTYYFYHEDLPEGSAQGYFDLYNNGTILNLTNWNTGSGNGYGGIYSTVNDLRIFIEALLVEKTIISQSSLDEMLTFTKPEPDANRANGLGIFKDFLERDSTEFAYGHRGRDLVYTADLFYFDKNKNTMAYLINYGTDGNSSLRDVFFEFRTEVANIIFE